MRLPGFSAETSLYKTTTHYSAISRSDQAGEEVTSSQLSMHDLVKSTLYFTHLEGRSWIHVYGDLLSPISVRECCHRCMAFPCADESCRRQRLASCNSKCRAEVIGGCNCPPGRVACTSSRFVGECCKPGDQCALDGCSPPNQICNGYGGCLGKCLPTGCCPPHRIVCNNECCAYGVKVCSAEGTCVGCGAEGQAPCPGSTCKGGLHLNIDLSDQLICTASCGHVHQRACRTTYRVPEGIRSRYRCFKNSKLSANGPADPSNCMCVHNSVNDVENDVSDNSGFCISTVHAPGDVPDPPDCDGADCTSKHEGSP
jgi:hypothetical protein